MKSKYFTLTLIALLAIILATTIQIVADVAAADDVPEMIADNVVGAPSLDIAAAQTATETMAAEGQTLAVVKERGKVRCIGHGGLIGFGFIDADTNEWAGFDVDFCKALAAAVLGDPEAVEILPADATQRFPLLQSGEGDVLIRNTTWTISRDTSLGFNFAPTTFYDGQGMMVRADSGIEKLEDLEGATVCVQQGTTTERNLADVMRALGVSYEPVVFKEADDTRTAYDEGRCDAFTTDKSGLIAEQTQLENPDDHIILEETMSKEPLGPLVRHGDDQWFDIVKWVTYGLFAAEEYGITQANVEEMAATSEDPVIRNLLGVEGDLGKGLGLDNDFVVKAVKAMGNYGEIYDRHLGPEALNVPRALNSQWTEGGLIYAPPFR
jgi:general L-amino acid transport system substrate-binding protein